MLQASGDGASLDIYTDAPRQNVGNLPGSDVILPIAAAEFEALEEVKDRSIFQKEPFAPVVCTPSTVRIETGM